MRDPARSGEDLARALGVSVEAVELTRSCDVIDLHVDSFIPPRLWGYDLREDHRRAPAWALSRLLRGRFFGHLDLPRIEDNHLTGGLWSITTNPARRASRRWPVFLENLARLRRFVETAGGEGRPSPMRLVRTAAEYDAARAAGQHAVMPVIQGGNALDAAPEGPASIPDRAVILVTLVHLTSSRYGSTSSPLRMGRARGLSAAGVELVERLDAERIFVDLAHIHPRGFWDAVRAHDASLPLIDSHTGVDGVRPHWRNLDDAQLKAIADTGGTVGIIFASGFLRPRGAADTLERVLDHVAHVIDTVGEDFVSLGSDYDGAITPPPDLRDGLGFPRLTQGMLDRGWSPERVAKVLGDNFLRAFRALRPV